MNAKTIPVSEFDLVIFGATGDLSRRKLIPALFNRMIAGQLPETSQIIGAARSNLDDKDFRDLVRASIKEFVPPSPDREANTKKFLDLLRFVQIDACGDQGWSALSDILGDDQDRVRVFYLSVSPTLFEPLAERLAGLNLNPEKSRIVVEKPLGTDMASARHHVLPDGRNLCAKRA